MLLSAVSVLVVAQSSSEVPEELMNNPVQVKITARLRQGKPEVLGGVGRLFQCHFVQHKTHTDCHGIEV